MSTKYTFYIADTNGKRTLWEGLSFKRARDMHAYTAASLPANVCGHGWYEEKCPLEFTEPENLTNVSEGAEV
jgi:hypothetical protein